MNNCYISLDDTFTYNLYDKAKCIEYFGEEYLEEYGQEIPQELLERYSKNREEFNAISKELDKYYEK